MGLDTLLNIPAKPSSTGSGPQSAVVVQSGPEGVLVSEIGGDARHPVGPCSGATRRTATGALQRLPVGTRVLLVHTDDGPWVAAHDEPVST